MERLEKYQYLGLMRSGTKADMLTCLNATTGNATAVKQATIVVHGLTPHLAHMEPHVLNIEIIDAVLDIYFLFTLMCVCVFDTGVFFSF